MKTIDIFLAMFGIEKPEPSFKEGCPYCGAKPRTKKGWTIHKAGCLSAWFDA